MPAVAELENSVAWYLYYHNSIIHKNAAESGADHGERNIPDVKTHVSRRDKKQIHYVFTFRKCIDEINATFACFIYFISTFKFTDEAYITRVLTKQNEDTIKMLHDFFLYSLFKDLYREGATQICQNRISCQGRYGCKKCPGRTDDTELYYLCSNEEVSGPDLWECKTHMLVERIKAQFTIPHIIKLIYGLIDEWWLKRQHVIIQKYKRIKCSDIYSNTSDSNKNEMYCKMKRAEKKCNTPKKNAKDSYWRNARAITEEYVTNVWRVPREEAPTPYSNYRYSPFSI